MANEIYGYNGKLLRVDLTSGKITTEPLDEATLKECVGGTGLGVKILYDEVPPDVMWSDPRNRMIFASGPLGGTRIGGSGTYTVVTAGALTNGATTCQANGYVGAYLRFSGFDAVVVQGAAKDWVYLHIHDGTAELKDARKFLGMDTYKTEDAVKEDLGQTGRAAAVACIGPAGENLVRFAVINNDRGHIAAHNGNGAVMGSKKLKAIAVSRGKGSVQLKDPEQLTAIAKEMFEVVKTRGYAGIDVYKYGTLEGIALQTKINTLPVRNLQTNIFDTSPEEAKKWTAEYVRGEYGIKRNPCWACQMNHCFSMKVTEGPFAGEVAEEPEYEGQASCGPMIGNKDSASAIVLNDYVDRMGMDVNEMGWLLAFTMECYEKGLITKKQTGGLEMTWGNVVAAREMISRIAKREGLGDVLAEGVMRAAQQIGGEAPKLAVHSMKGNAPRSHDHRIMWFELLDTNISNTGTIESGQAAPFDLLGLKPLSNHYGYGMPDEVANLVAKTKGTMQFEDSVGTCRFNTITNIALICKAVNAATGWDIGFSDAMKIGRRAVNITRVFNLRRGISPELERPSPKYGSVPVDGPAKGINPMATWEQMRGRYYELMGWDKNGIPTPETLKEVGLSRLIPDLPKAFERPKK